LGFPEFDIASHLFLPNPYECFKIHQIGRRSRVWFSHRVAENAIHLRDSPFGPDSYSNGNLGFFSIENF